MKIPRSFADRADAGRHLAADVAARDFADPVVLGLPRGGLPVAVQVADRLDAPLDVIVVRKVGAPGHREFAVGALGEGGVEVIDNALVRRLGVPADALQSVIEQERRELQRRVARYRGQRAPVGVEGRTAVVVDDGIATGRTARAAADVLRARRAARLVLAVPVASRQAVSELRLVYDEVVVLRVPRSFVAVSPWYVDFTQTTDAEVERLLASARSDAPG